jgi:DNA-binding transcriptional regulator PaaX
MFGIPDLGLYKKQTIYNSIHNLKKKGLILTAEDKAYITKQGKKLINRKLNSLKQFQSTFSKDAPKMLVIMYDIPENRKAEREWFRFHLKKFGYLMIQRSVWVGPAPLPKEFMDYTKGLHLYSHLKVLHLAKPYSENSLKF